MVVKQKLIELLPHRILKIIFYRKQLFSSLKHPPPEEVEVHILKYLVNEEDIVFDIGGNRGLYLYYFSKKNSPENIYCFEPNWNLYKTLIKLYPKVTMNNLALTEKITSQKMEFKIPKINGKILESRGTLSFDNNENEDEDSKVIEVNTTSLDNYIACNGIRKVDFIKIDVEGHEFNVIKGSRKTLIKHNPILLVEIEQRHHNFSVNLIFDYLKDLGYSIYYFNIQKAKIININNFDIELQKKIKSKFYINNFFFIPKNKINSDQIDSINTSLM